MDKDNAELRQALRTGGAHVLLVEVVHHGGAHVARVGGDRSNREGAHGQNQVIPLLPHDREILALRRIVGQDGPHLGEEDDQQKASEEDGGRVGEQTRDRDHVVGRFISFHCLPHAEGNRDDEGEDGGQEGQEDGARQAGGQQVVHGLVVLVGVSEVAVRNFVQVVDVLLGDRAIVSVLVVEGRELFFGRILTEGCSGCAARLGLEKDEGDDGDQEDDDDCLAEAFEDELDHCELHSKGAGARMCGCGRLPREASRRRFTYLRSTTTNPRARCRRWRRGRPG